MAVARSTLPLELNAEVTTADGARFRWGANEPADRRLRNFSFSTKIGEGFSQAQGQLARSFLLDYPDLNLVDTITFVGADGSVAYEGRNSEMPRELSDSSSIGVSLAGWMTHASDRKFTEIYVDRDLSSWTEIPLARRVNLLSNNYQPGGPSSTPDENSEASVLTQVTDSWVAPFKPVSEAWYDVGPGLMIGGVAYTMTKRGVMAGVTATPAVITAYIASNQTPTTATSTGNIVVSGNPVSSLLVATIPNGRYAFLQLLWDSTPAGLAGQHLDVYWSKLAVYGRHGLAVHDGQPGEPSGVFASDVIKNIANRWCPKLGTGGVTDSSYVIQHLTFKDPITPFDALQQVNKYHLFQLAVWEDKTLHWHPFDLTDYDWQVRTDSVGTTFQAQGPSIATVFNGITVAYTDLLTGVKGYLTPDTNPELRDSDPTNPWNRHGIDRWDDLELSYPSTAQDAAQAGRAALADRNRAKHPGQITVKGYIKDRAGNEQPGWKVRAGDTVAITDHPYDAPRLIHETSWDDESKTLQMTVDGPPSILDAQVDRVMNALTARGLS